MFIKFLSENLGTIIVAASVLALVAFLTLKLVKDKKAGKSGCSCGCSSCPMSGKCPSSSEDMKKSE
jgi:hypothetical protein